MTRQSEDLDLDSFLDASCSRREEDTASGENIILAVHMTDEDIQRLQSPEGFRCEHEAGSDLICSFCQRQRPQIPYGWPFVSVTVYSATEDLVVVCTADFRTTASNAARRKNEGEPIGSYIRQFRVLSDMTFEKKTEKLLKARHDSDSGRYPEARLHRHIFSSDVERRL